MKTTKTKQIALCALFVAVICGAAWISVPTPFGVAVTLQTFGVALTGFCLKTKYATISTAAYILLGAAGMPVFSSFSGGVGILIGPTGGFLWGFLALAALCGVATTVGNKFLKYSLITLSILLCHMVGVIQFCIVSGVNVWVGFISASLPFLLKDLIVVFVSFVVAEKINGILNR